MTSSRLLSSRNAEPKPLPVGRALETLGMGAVTAAGSTAALDDADCDLDADEREDVPPGTDGPGVPDPLAVPERATASGLRALEPASFAATGAAPVERAGAPPPPTT